MFQLKWCRNSGGSAPVVFVLTCGNSVVANQKLFSKLSNVNLLDHAAGDITVCYMQYLLHRTDVALRFLDKNNRMCVVEYILPLCDSCLFCCQVFIVYHGGT